MKNFNVSEIEELSFSATAGGKGNNNGNNDTHTHKGWCEMHKHPENGICTCGATQNPNEES